MVSTIKISNAKMRFYFVTNIVIISELVNNYLKGTEIFSQSWLFSAFSFLIAYIFYMIFVEDIQIVNGNNYKLKRTTTDFMRFSTLFLFSQLIINYFEYGTVGLNFIYIIKTILIISGYIISDFIFMDKIMNMKQYQLLIYDIIKMFTSEYAVVLFLFNNFNYINLVDSFSFLFGYASWELVTKKIVL